VTGVIAVSDLIKLTVRPVRGRENVMSMSYTTGRLYTITGRGQASDTSALGYKSPAKFEEEHARQIAI